jgi:hypothetical protein
MINTKMGFSESKPQRSKKLQDLETTSERVNVPNDSEINPKKYNRHMHQCLCRGKYFGENSGQHVVFAAFLDYENDEITHPGSMNGSMMPINRLATILGNTNIDHCQLVFMDTQAEEWVTISTDFDRGVHVMSRKKFAARGWHFLCLLVTAEQELAMYNFLIDQVGKGFSRIGILGLYLRPVDTLGYTWFCSPLMLEALRAGGLCLDWPREAYKVPPHELHEYLTSKSFEGTCIELSCNPVFAHAVRTGRLRLK